MFQSPAHTWRQVGPTLPRGPTWLFPFLGTRPRPSRVKLRFSQVTFQSSYVSVNIRLGFTLTGWKRTEIVKFDTPTAE